jgi:hypothetical protein
MYFSFIATDQFDFEFFDSVESFVDAFPDFQTIWLKDENELNLLLNLMGMPEIIEINTSNPVFCKYWDLSGFKLPELNNEQFEKFYYHWLQTTDRDSNMNDYGSLLLLQGLSSKWNKLKYRYVVKESPSGT